MKTEYHISLKPDANPVCLFTPRKVPHPLLPKVKEELDRMVQQGVISPVTEPTSWCSGMVPVLKPNGSVRVCVDLVQLNQSVKREAHPMFSVDESLAKLGQSKIFSKLDANSGFWQMPLDQESRLLTTFITPYGRFCFNRVPFGICSAPEVYQRAMSNILEGIDGVICHVDDVLVHGTTQAEHDARLRAVLERLQKAGVTLNNKCEFSKQSMKFLGHIIDETGIYPDPEKTEAVRNFPRPEKVKDLQRFMGLVNQMGKFIPDLASHNEPLRQLLKKENVWHWGQAQEQSFQRIKEELAAPRSLAHYNPKRPTILSTDASNLGLGAVLSQLQDDGSRRPVSYASRSLTETEKRYAVIEKEALAVTWACKSYLLVVDYYSRWVEVKRLHNQLAATVISALKEVFATHGIPDLVISDNGPQFACELFQQFATIYGFTHVTSSPRYPRANGEAERAVGTVKEILKKNEDPYLGLLSYRSTPLQNGLAPCELLMSRQLKTQLPALPKTLQPKLRINDLVKLKQKEEVYRTNQQRNHDQRHKAKEQSKLKTGEAVWIRDQDRMGKVLTPSRSPRSYIVQTEKGTLRRNRAALVPTKPTELEQQETDIAPELLSQSEVPPVEYEPAKHPAAPTQETKQPDTYSKVTPSGRVVKQPKRLIEDI